MKALTLGFIAMSLAGCVGESVAFHSPDGKQTVVCSASGHGLIGAPLASDSLHQCKEAYLKAGYIEGPAPVAAPPAPPAPQADKP